MSSLRISKPESVNNPDSAMAAARENDQALAKEFTDRNDMIHTDYADFSAGWDASRKHQAQEIGELVAGLREAKIYFIGMAAYLATFNTDVIVENLETTIAALHAQESKAESLLSRYHKV